MKETPHEISDELLAAYLDGNATEAETNQILQQLSTDKELQAILHISGAVDAATAQQTYTILPMAQLAAENADKQCSFECESFILGRDGYDIDRWTLLQEAKANNWLRQGGTPLHHVGRLLELKGMAVKRKYEATQADLTQALSHGYYVITVVDKRLLAAEVPSSGPEPSYHAILITGISPKDKTIHYLDLNILTDISITSSDFEAAWKCSHHYMVTATSREQIYNPEPINLEDVEIEDDLLDLQEAIAENAHDVWARARIDEGWTYGPERNDTLKKNPDLLPYASLPESEKEYDRIMAMNTIRLVKKLGYELVKK